MITNKITFKTLLFLIIISLFSCSPTQEKNSAAEEEASKIDIPQEEAPKVLDKRISLNLNAKQKNHQLKNMRSHLLAVQSIISLLATDQFDEASLVAYSELGSTTEMKLMCASFGDENFEKLGLEFHSAADKMSETFKQGNKDESLKALSSTMNSCIKCHATYKQ